MRIRQFGGGAGFSVPGCAAALANACARFFAFAVLAICPIGLAGCSSGGSYDTSLGVSSSPRVASGGNISKGGGVYKVGRPYRVGGRWYHPHEDPNYNRLGTASWYGNAFHGRKTANGEVYDMYALTAGHPTLPLPSYAYVTNLQNGRTVLVRINDRGPYAKDRLIDLSYQTARALGYHNQGLARVRVRYAGRAPLNGDDSAERRFLASQSWSGSRVSAAPAATISTASIDAPTWSAQSYRQAQVQSPLAAAPSALGGRRPDTYLRVGPFASEAEAQRLRFMLAGADRSIIEPFSAAGSTSYRLRLGPYDDASAASAMARIAAAGFEPDASAEMTAQNDGR